MQAKRGLRTNKRVNARNFIHESAQKRLDETVAPANTQYQNSLFVNAVKIDLYQLGAKTRPCSCEKTEVLPELRDIGGEEAVVPTHTEGTDTHVSIGLQDNFFGTHTEQEYNDEVLDAIDDTGYTNFHEEPINGSINHVESVLSGQNTRCGICYKSGWQPGYIAYGKQRSILTTYDIQDVDGYFINRTKAPHAFEKQHKEGYVEFAIKVPKYFKLLTWSIRDNTDIIEGAKLYTTTGALTSQELRAHAGKQLILRIRETEFTHVSIEFDLGQELRANISAETATLDYSRLDATSSLNIVLPPEVPNVQSGDIVVIKDRKLVLKLNDRNPRQTATKRIMGWESQARVLQPTESEKRIHVGYKLK